MKIICNNGYTITRKDFLKLSGAAAAVLAIQNLAGCSTPATPNVPSIDYSKDILLKNCNLIDVIKGKIVPDSTIHIRNGIIQSIDARDKQFMNAVTVDAGGTYIIPGLIDAHCHPTISSTFSVDTVDLSRHIALQKRQFTISLEYGITTYRDVGSFPLTLHSMLKDIRKGKLNGPRVVYCNSMLNIKGGHPDIPPTDAHPLANLLALFTGMVMTNFKDFSELKHAIVKNAEGASFIKITMDNKSVFCKREDIPVYSDEMLKYIFDYAGKKALPVSGHVHRKFGFDRAMDYPINSLEHIVSDTLLSDKDIELMVKKNISIVPTMTVGLSYMIDEAYDDIPAQFKNDFIMNELKIRRDYLANDAYRHCDPVIHRKNMEALKDYRLIGIDNLWKKKKFLVNPELYFGMIQYGTRNLMKMRDAGVTIGCGIDAGMPLLYFGGLYRELEFLSRAGFRNDEILRVATINSAKILKLESTIGSLEKGKSADLVILAKNPLADVQAYRNPEFVIKDGRFVFSRNKLPVTNSSRDTRHM